MYAYREVIILDDLQKLVLNQPLPLASGQLVEVLVVADNTIPSPSHSTWREFFAKRDRILADQPNEIKEFMSARSQLREQHFRDPFEGWKE
jgi:hypothetical protein